jgi:FKBP-type peptidyl-prolyl cis-trans isomerase SlyD
MQRFSFLCAGFFGLVLLPSIALAQKEKETPVIKNGSVVSFEYTLSDEKGKAIESNKGKKPLTYTHGSGQILPGLQKGLAGMKVSEQKTVKLKPEEAYGQIDPKAVSEVPREQIPPEAQKAGATVFARNAKGTFPVRVREVKEKTVLLDFNHPLAGKALTFNVKILDIKQATTK